MECTVGILKAYVAINIIIINLFAFLKIPCQQFKFLKKAASDKKKILT